MQHTEKYGYFTLKGWKKQLIRLTSSMPVNFFGRKLALILRKIVIKSLPKYQDCIDAQINGINMRVYLKDNVSERKFLFMPQFFDPYERDFIKQHLKNDGIFLDIGANAGIYSLTAAKIINNSGHIYAIEPHPTMRARLQYNVKINGFDKKIKILNYAITDKMGEISLIIDDSNMGGNSLTQKRGSKSIKVNGTTLLELLKQEKISKINIMKIDIEGAEDKALIPFFQNAHKNLYPKYIIMENSKDKWADDLENILLSKGYVISHTSKMNNIWSYQK